MFLLNNNPFTIFYFKIDVIAIIMLLSLYDKPLFPLFRRRPYHRLVFQPNIVRTNLIVFVAEFLMFSIRCSVIIIYLKYTKYVSLHFDFTLHFRTNYLQLIVRANQGNNNYKLYTEIC